MAVTVNKDLTVEVLQDTNAAKLVDRQQALRAAIQRGEPKCLGVSQLMLGLMIMAYSIPLHCTDYTEVIWLGVPWWSGITFIIAGSIAIVLDKNCTVKILHACLIVNLVSTVLSVISVIIYSVDIQRNPETPCIPQSYENCDDKHYATKLSKGVKSALLLFTLAQTVISAVLGFLLYRQKRDFQQYNPLNQDAISTQGIVHAEGN